MKTLLVTFAVAIQQSRESHSLRQELRKAMDKW